MRSSLDPMKKAKQRWFLDRFLEKEGLSTDSIPECREKPDFVITVGGIRIGLEVTEYFFPGVGYGVPHHFQVLREQAIEEAWRIYLAGGGRALIVNAAFTDNPKPLGPKNSKEVPEFAKRFEQVVRSHESSIEGFKSRLFTGWPAISELDFYSIRTCRTGVDGFWGRAGPTHQEVLEAHHIQWYLDRKARKYPSYIGDFEKVWLLIFTEGGLRSIPNEIGEEARNSVFDFPFGRAYWFDSFPNVEITRLRGCVRKG